MVVDINGSCPCISMGDLSGPSLTSILFFPVIRSISFMISVLMSSMSYAPVGKCSVCHSYYIVPSALTLFLYEKVKLLLGGLPLNGSDLTLGQL